MKNAYSVHHLILIMRVLVVHGDQNFLQTFNEQMDSWYVDGYTNGLEGLMAAKITAYDMIICSQSLPVITGIEMIRSIRNLSVNRNTPVIFLADGNENEDLIKVYHMLSANFLTLDEISAMKNLEV